MHAFLYFRQCPINLLGCDLLTRINHCVQPKLLFINSNHKQPLPAGKQLWLKAQPESQTDLASVYWLSENDTVEKSERKSSPQLEPALPPHYMLNLTWGEGWALKDEQATDMAVRTTNVMDAAANEVSLKWGQLYFLNESVSKEPHVIVAVAQGQEKKSLTRYIQQRITKTGHQWTMAFSTVRPPRRKSTCLLEIYPCVTKSRTS